MVRTRFAPSPSGSLHPGNARVAVLNWLFARHHGGTFVLRIEDTDVERTVPGAEEQIREDLCWLGLEWDEGIGFEGPAEEGPYGPYRQSERAALYRAHADRLVEAGAAFPCFCSPSELAAKREAALARGEQPHYDGTCRDLSAEEVAERKAQGQRPVIRFRVSDTGEITVRDAVRGEVRFAASEFGDFIILRADLVPTYNFAVVVDDALMEISHVVRGAGHLSNTPRQVLIFDALGYRQPVFVHVPTVLGPDRQKLSKRHGAKALAEYRREGVHPDALVNYLSLLSWSSPSGDELLTRERLINEVSLERIGIADAVFDPTKLAWLSSKHIERMPLPELVEAVIPYLDRDRFPLDDDALPVAVGAIRTRLTTFAEINDHLAVFVPTFDDDEAAARAGLRSDASARAVLRAASDSFGALHAWDEEGIGPALRLIGKECGVRGRALYEPLRVATTGHEHGPPLVAILTVLGRPTVLRLLDECLASGPEADAAADDI